MHLSTVVLNVCLPSSSISQPPHQSFVSPCPSHQRGDRHRTAKIPKPQTLALCLLLFPPHKPLLGREGGRRAVRSWEPLFSEMVPWPAAPDIGVCPRLARGVYMGGKVAGVPMVCCCYSSNNALEHLEHLGHSLRVCVLLHRSNAET